MGLQDRDYMKRDKQAETKGKLEQLKYFQQPRKTAILKNIITALLIFSGLLFIMEIAFWSTKTDKLKTSHNPPHAKLSRITIN
jgi:hypothetical protein